MLEKSRFNRRLHNVDMLINDLFHQIGMMLKEISDCTEYLIDSFPVPIFDNIRIFQVKIIKSEYYRGYTASKKRYFYGVKVQLLTTKSGIPVEFAFMPGSAADVRALNSSSLNLPLGSEIYADSAYTDYNCEDDLRDSSEITLNVMKKKNSKRPYQPWFQYIKQSICHDIETGFIAITSLFPISSINSCSQL